MKIIIQSITVRYLENNVALSKDFYPNTQIIDPISAFLNFLIESESVDEITVKKVYSTTRLVIEKLKGEG